MKYITFDGKIVKETDKFIELLGKDRRMFRVYSKDYRKINKRVEITPGGYVIMLKNSIK